MLRCPDPLCLSRPKKAPKATLLAIRCIYLVGINDLAGAPPVLQGHCILDHDFGVSFYVLSGKRRLDQLAPPPVVVAFADENRRFRDERVADIVERALREERPLLHEKPAYQVGVEYDTEILG